MARITLAGGKLYDTATRRISEVLKSFQPKPPSPEKLAQIARAKRERTEYRQDLRKGRLKKPRRKPREGSEAALIDPDLPRYVEVEGPDGAPISQLAAPEPENFALVQHRFGEKTAEALESMLVSVDEVRRRRGSLHRQASAVRELEPPTQLGEPNRDRAKKSREGFDVDQLAAGVHQDDKKGGVVRSRERAMLTPLALLQERVAMEILAIQQAGGQVPAVVRASQTPSDEIIAHNPRVVHDWMEIHLLATAHGIKSSSYEGMVSSGETEKIPFRDNDRAAWSFYAWTRANAYNAVLTVLEQVTTQCYPERMANALNIPIEQAVTKAGIGHYWGRRERNARDAEKIADGALAVAAHILNELWLDWHTLFMREKRLKKIAFDNRKKVA